MSGFELTPEELKALQDREDELWQELDEQHPETAEGTRKIVSELIEVTLEIEKNCNK